MTQAGWDRAWLTQHCHPRQMAEAWRGVETQYIAASMKLVNSFAEQDLLEQMLEDHKPPAPVADPGKHYLLLSPFRYAPAHGSRFRPANMPGLWYGSSTLEGACAEIAYWRHKFLTDAIDLAGDVLTTEHTFYSATVDGNAINLMDEPWNAQARLWKHPADYSATQDLAEAAMAASVQWIQYESVRAPTHALAAVLTPDALQSSSKAIEDSRQEWFCQTSVGQVMLRSKKGQQTITWLPD